MIIDDRQSTDVTKSSGIHSSVSLIKSFKYENFLVLFLCMQ